MSAGVQPWASGLRSALDVLPAGARCGAIAGLQLLCELHQATGAVRCRVALAVVDEAFDELTGQWSAGVVGDDAFEGAADGLDATHAALTAGAQRPAARRRPPVPWDQVPLGAAPDRFFALLFGVTPQAVRAARRVRHVPAPDPGYVQWTGVQFGELPDTELGRSLGCSTARVWQARRERGIDACPRPWELVDWSPAEPGSAPDPVVARIVGVPVGWVAGERKRRDIPAFEPYCRRISWPEQPLGMVPHAALARALGVSEATVARRCRELGRPAFRGDVLSQEGEPLHSAYEAMLDAVLHAHGIGHEHQVAVGPGRRTADFRLGRLYIEVAGMAGTPFYDAQQQSKQAEYRALGLDARWLSAGEVTDLYFGQDFVLPLRWRPRPTCADCGRTMSRKGTCPRCWPRGRYGTGTCQQCGEPMALDSIAQRFHKACAAEGRWRPPH